MSEWIAFMGGLIAMCIVWFVDSIRHESPYWRGYRDGYKEAIEAYKKYGMNPKEETE